MLQCRRGEVWLVDLKPDRTGHEIDKERPAVIVSCDVLNKRSFSMVAVVPITEAQGKLNPDGTAKFDNHVVLIDSALNGLKKKSVAACEQVRAVDRSRLTRKLGDLDPAKLEEVTDALVFVLDLYA